MLFDDTSRPVNSGVMLLSLNYRHKIAAFGGFILGGLDIEKISCVYALSVCFSVASIQ